VDATERVLVLPRGEVPGGCDFLGLRPASHAEVDALRAAIAGHGAWVERPLAEEDPSLKQVIPYVVVRDRSVESERVFLMERTDAGGDRRLHHRATIGVGGHLNPVDRGNATRDTLTAGLHREWGEELEADWVPEFALLGYLNDDRNAVGSVHLGVVFTVEADGRRLAVRERDKLSGRFAPVPEVLAAWDRMETWSQLVVASVWGEPTA
jgi:predicted NUDIX family phosphoesterase